MAPGGRYSKLRLRKPNRSIVKYVLYGIVFTGFLVLLYQYNECQRRSYLEKIIPQYINSLIYIKSDEKTTVDEWKPIGNPSLRFKIYSSFFETRTALLKGWHYERGLVPYGAVRIVAILPFSIRFNTIKCYLENSDGTNQTAIAQHVKAINENRQMKFSAFMVVCPLANSIKEQYAYLPQRVSLIYEQEESMRQPTAFVDIRYSSGEHPKSLAICVGPFHNNYSEALRLVEFVEAYKLLGAEHFYFYNKSTTPAVDKVAQYYQDMNIASVQKWNFDGYEFEKEVRYEGIFAAINDCLYRADFDGFNYIAIVDVDEILMPLQNQSLIEFISQHDSPNINSFNFRGAMFHQYHNNGSSNIPTDQKNRFLYTQIKTERTLQLFPYHNRSKYIAKIKLVVEVGNHFVFNEGMIKGGKEYLVPIYEGLLFHYRTDCFETATCNKPTHNETTARRYENQIWSAVDDVCAVVFEDGVCPLG